MVVGYHVSRSMWISRALLRVSREFFCHGSRSMWISRAAWERESVFRAEVPLLLSPCSTVGRRSLSSSPHAASCTHNHEWSFVPTAFVRFSRFPSAPEGLGDRGCRPLMEPLDGAPHTKLMGHLRVDPTVDGMRPNRSCVTTITSSLDHDNTTSST